MDIVEQDLTKFSTIRVKSHAKYFCLVRNIKDLEQAIYFKVTNKLNHVIIGNGSNILFSKKEYDDILFINVRRILNQFQMEMIMFNHSSDTTFCDEKFPASVLTASNSELIFVISSPKILISF